MQAYGGKYGGKLPEYKKQAFFQASQASMSSR